MWKFLRDKATEILREEADGLFLDLMERQDSLERETRNLRLELNNLKALLETLNPPPEPPQL